MQMIQRYDKMVRLDKAHDCPMCSRTTKAGRKLRMLWSTINGEPFLQVFVCKSCWSSNIKKPLIVEHFEKANQEAFLKNKERYGFVPEATDLNKIPNIVDLPALPNINEYEGDHGMIDVPHDQYIAMYRLIRKHPEGVLENKHEDENKIWHRFTNLKHDIDPFKAPWLLHRVEMSPPVHYAHRLLIEWYNSPEVIKKIEEGILDFNKEAQQQQELEDQIIEDKKRNEDKLKEMAETTKPTEFKVEPLPEITKEDNDG